MNDNRAALPTQRLRLGKYQLRINTRISSWQQEDVPHRLAAKDTSLWPERNGDEIVSRLGWLDLPSDFLVLLQPLEDLKKFVMQEKIRRVFLLGMGGSSLAPEVFQTTFAGGREPMVEILDSTHPEAIRTVLDRLDGDNYLFVIASKSGSTLETMSLFYACWRGMERWHSQGGLRFVAITDPGSSLEALAERRGFWQIYSAPEDVGGRFSALSVFGLVPAALAGIEIDRLMTRAQRMAKACAELDSPAMKLGAALGELAIAGRDKLTFLTSPGLAQFPAWVEQLVAESLGKEGRGVVPVVGEPMVPVDRYREDRVFVALMLAGEEGELPVALDQLAANGHPVVEIVLNDRYELGAEMYRWESAVAAASIVMAVQPFDQPDVESTKVFTRAAMGEGGGGPITAPHVYDDWQGDGVHGEIQRWLATARPGDYFCIQAFLYPDYETEAAVRSLQNALFERTGLATTVGYGPRFLHSTGQLHKGGPNRGLFLQLIDQPATDLLVPENEYSFGTLIRAQADGDAAALAESGRRLVRFDLGGRIVPNLRRLRAAVRG